MAFDNRPSRRHGIVQYNQNNFDPSSGQAFAEMTVRARPRRHLSRLDPARDVQRSPNGPESLEKLALRQFLRYVDDTTPETMNELTTLLTYLPWPLGQKAWEEVQKRDNLQSPLSVWRSFTAAYPGEGKIGYHRAATNVPDPDELPLYLERMNSDDFSWLTCLTITEQSPHVTFRRPDIINISRLRNLVALDIGSTDAAGKWNDLVADSVIRSWARLVHEANSFPKLQLMVIRNQPGITARSLEYLSAFPSLTLFGIKDCFPVSTEAEESAKSLGWTSFDEHGIMAQIKRDINQSSTWDEPIRQCYRRSSTLLPPNAISDAPLLNFRLGPTPSSIIFNNTLSPLVFFRCLRCSATQTEAVVPLISYPLLRQPPVQLQNTLVKRRKLKKQVDLTGCLDEMLGGARADASTGDAITSTPARPHTVGSLEGWPDHSPLKALSQIPPSRTSDHIKEG